MSITALECAKIRLRVAQDNLSDAQKAVALSEVIVRHTRADTVPAAYEQERLVAKRVMCDFLKGQVSEAEEEVQRETELEKYFDTGAPKLTPEEGEALAAALKDAKSV